MTNKEAEIRALRAERDELDVENRALRADVRRLTRRLFEAETSRGVFAPVAPAEAAT